ncbi:hypothetical protein [Mesorhizobium sophorae]|uniref:hypothetical protein n=1 Tax=Mesorhizobium sophorae TaxID=1300294 RepID=UPI000BA34AEB|nr:hypothetical protein [Mesorhizobium sophorae]
MSVSASSAIKRSSAIALIGSALTIPFSGLAVSADLVASTTNELQQRFAASTRYVIGSETSESPHPNCSEVKAGDPLLQNELVKPYSRLVGHGSASILDCNYEIPRSTRRGWVIVVAASPRNLAERIVGACNEVAVGKAEACVNKLMNTADFTVPAGSNSFIFPITGFVREPCKGGENLIGFRHGVTIQYANGPTGKSKLPYCLTGDKKPEWQREVGLSFGTFAVFRVGRLAAITRAEAAVDGDFPEPGEGTLEGLQADPFQAYVRDNEIKAVETGYDRMMVVKAALKMDVPVPAKR